MYDVIIIGSGPAGFTAAIYTSRANLKTLVIGGERWGGQLMLTTMLENFPGFPDGIEGPELMMRMRRQAEKFGAEIIEKNFVKGDFRRTPFLAHTDEKVYEGKSVIIATGADQKWLGVPGEQERIGRGVSSCAPCDGMFFRNKNIIVVGGGDSAMEEAIMLTKYAKHVVVMHRRDSFRASFVMQEKAKSNPKISFLLGCQIIEILGDQKVERVMLRSLLRQKATEGQARIKNKELREMIDLNKGEIISEDGEEIVWEMPIDGIFVAIGRVPNSKVFEGITVDSQGYIAANNHMKTNIDGVFVAGDVYDTHYDQAITAAGFGCAAGLEVSAWLEKRA
ncbi:FAD-dependent oxidoreductase [Patescibacteria group bacterium]|nr:FAD-dependent oxidoreductase [Patescibacteria group bacterium]MBU4099479.1 FAD-dependent oxidoreductase [Patescibacteria group bacterium]